MPIYSFKKLAEKANLLSTIELSTRDHHSLYLELRDFLQDYYTLGIPAEPIHVWHRARIIGKSGVLSNLNQMIYPENGSPDYGRAQLPNSKVLYASWNQIVAFDEIGAKKGDLVQSIVFRLIPGKHVIDHAIGEYMSYYQRGRSSIGAKALENTIADLSIREPIQFQRFAYIDSVIASFFRKVVIHSYEYKLSAIYSELMHKSGSTLIYPSVKNAMGRNIAIPATTFDENYEVLSTDVFEIAESFGYGFYQAKLLQSSCDFTASGDINWHSVKTCPYSWDRRNGHQINYDYRGWKKA